jgi:predicted RNase H-like HicB family nuclease
METIKVKVFWEDKNYSACTENYEKFGGIVVAAGKTLEELKQKFQSALQFHIQGCLADGDTLPEFLKAGEYNLDYTLETSALLHTLDGVLTRSAIARATGINQRQIGHYASGIRRPRPEMRTKIITGIRKINRELEMVM